MTEALLLCGLVWGCIGYSILRGYRRTQHMDRYVLITWTIFILFGVIYTLRIPAAPPFIDGYFGGSPVTFVTIHLAVMGAVAAYSLSLRWLVQRSPGIVRLRRFHTWLLWATPGCAVLMLALLVAYAGGIGTWLQVEYTMKGLIECYGLLQAGLVLVPINVAMFRQEQVFPMRVKHLATLVFIVTFATSAAVTIVSIPPIILTGQPNQGPNLIPRGQIAAICLVVILVPHRWLAQLLVLRRLGCYVRLAGVERRLGRLVTIRREPLSLPQMINAEYIEMTIYITVINILDNYRRVDLNNPAGGALVDQIEALLTDCSGYDELVEGLCHVKR